MRSLSLLMICGALPAAAHASFGDRIVVSNGEFMAGRQRIWINGVNTPWHNWNDFGGEFDYNWWDSHFQALHDSGINAARVWVSCNGEVGVVIDGAGRVSGATRAHWDNLDSLFEIARRRQVYVMATLMSFDHLKDNHPDYRSWRNWLNSDRNIDSYVGNYLVPFVRRYRDTPWLWAIDLMNEPDWVFENREGGRFPWIRLQDYFARAALAVHENSRILVTVGMAMPKYNSDTAEGAKGNKVGDLALKAGLGDPGARLDFYSTHYYDWCGENWGRAPDMTPGAYGMPADKPSIFSELPAKGTKDRSTGQDYESAYRNGWQGAMAWSSDGVDEMGDLTEAGPATRAFSERHPEVVFP